MMLRLLVRVWHYSAALFTSAFNAHADPRIQIDQAIEEAREQHLRLADQTAAVIGGELDLQRKLTRAASDITNYERSAARALHLAAAARSNGDPQRAASFEHTAQVIAAQLATAESSLGDLRELYERAVITSGAARRSLEQSRFQLQRHMVERSKLLSDIEAAQLQERMADAISAMDRFAPAGTIPSLPEMRERIDQRIAKGAGRLQVAADSVESRMVEVERAVTDARGAERLEEIRRREGLAPSLEE
jgi:phage shock protein A